MHTHKNDRSQSHPAWSGRKGGCLHVSRACAAGVCRAWRLGGGARDAHSGSSSVPQPGRGPSQLGDWAACFQHASICGGFCERLENREAPSVLRGLATVHGRDAVLSVDRGPRLVCGSATRIGDPVSLSQKKPSARYQSIVSETKFESRGLSAVGSPDGTARVCTVSLRLLDHVDIGCSKVATMAHFLKASEGAAKSLRCAHARR